MLMTVAEKLPRLEGTNETSGLTIANTVVHENFRFSHRLDNDRSCITAREVSFEGIEACLSSQAMRSAAPGPPIIQ
jgi:hypothetical protein